MAIARQNIRHLLLATALAEGLGIATEHADILLILASRFGETLTSAQVQYLVDTHKPLRLNTLQERIRAIREVMGRDTITGYLTAAERRQRVLGGFAPGGYGLSAEGLAKCMDALRRTGARLPDLLAAETRVPLRTAAKA